MGDFMALRLYGDKKLKFSQGKALKALQPAQEDKVTEWSKRGVCTGITMLWVKNRKSFNHHTPEEMTERGQSAHYLYKRAFKTDENDHGLSEVQKIVALFQHENIAMRDFDMPILAPTKELEDYVDSWLRHDTTHPRGALLSVDLEGNGKASGHALGLYKSSHRLEFFDSNCGWYEIYGGKEKDFIRVWRICMKQIGWKAKFSGLIVV